MRRLVLKMSLSLNNFACGYRLLVHPVALRKGRLIFSAFPSPFGLRVVDATQFDGPVALVYRPA
ncbi:MAG: hypothetical protein ABSF08_02855 [Candidatus Cybelea sp.]